MIKDQYLKELSISDTQKLKGVNNTKKDTMKIQSWLNLFELANAGSGTSTGIDGDFGPATDEAVKRFQRIKKITANGIVDDVVFQKLVQPLQAAFENRIAGNNLRQLVIDTADNHLKYHPFELVVNRQNNSGPWVRSYMNSNEGESWYWCMGFVQTIIDQAASQLDKSFKTLMPLTFSCDTVGMTGLQKGNLIRYNKVRQQPGLVKTGDIFLVQKTTFDWVHTGIILAVKNGIFETIEGNTNTAGSANGNGVYKRIRNFMSSKLDVFSIAELAD